MRRHLNLTEIDLLAHSAGAAIDVLYAARYPEHIDRHSKEGQPAHNAAVPCYYADDALDPVTTRKAVAEFGKPVWLLAGEYDVGLSPGNAAEYAGLFEHAELAVQHGAGHLVRGERAPWCRRWLVQVDGGEVVPRSVELR